MNETIIHPCMMAGHLARWALILCSTIACLAPATTAEAADNRFAVQLIWGTDGAKPKDEDLKDIDPKLTEKLRAVFKWKNYYEVRRKDFEIKSGVSDRIVLSKHCALEVEDLGGHEVEVRFYGEGKRFLNKKQKVPPGELFVVGGNAVNKTAWFVVLTRKAPDAK